MEYLQEIRQYLFDLRKRFFSPRRKRKPVPILQGLPEGLLRETINELCRAHFNSIPASFQHQHLSGWKTSGAYRIFVTLEGGREIRLIYKTAIYNEVDIPALSGLPTRPGPAEYTILSQAAGPLEPYLPCIYLAEETTPGALYRYIMEDLAENYRRPSEDADILRIANHFPVFHEAILDWKPASRAGLIQYGREFSTALQSYALPRLEQFASQEDDPTVRELLDNWEAVTRIHLEPEFFETGDYALIHGDPNYTNVYLNKRDPRKIKFVDWEWAGFGSPYADLVSLLKGGPTYVERRAVERMAASLNQPAEKGFRSYNWGHLERGILDSAFLSVQALSTGHETRFSLHNAVSTAARRSMRAYRHLI